MYNSKVPSHSVALLLSGVFLNFTLSHGELEGNQGKHLIRQNRVTSRQTPGPHYPVSSQPAQALRSPNLVQGRDLRGQGSRLGPQ